MSVSEFFHMGGFGAFVWSSYGVTLALIIIELVVVRKQHRTILTRLGRMIRINAKVNK